MCFLCSTECVEQNNCTPFFTLFTVLTLCFMFSVLRTVLRTNVAAAARRPWRVIPEIRRPISWWPVTFSAKRRTRWGCLEECTSSRPILPSISHPSVYHPSLSRSSLSSIPSSPTHQEARSMLLQGTTLWLSQPADDGGDDRSKEEVQSNGATASNSADVGKVRCKHMVLL